MTAALPMFLPHPDQQNVTKYVDVLEDFVEDFIHALNMAHPHAFDANARWLPDRLDAAIRRLIPTVPELAKMIP